MEHLLAAAPEVAALLEALPQLRILVTSQAPLRLSAERCMSLDALDDEAALTLIGRTARRRGATLAEGAADRAALLAVVHLLDGLPLALELAAARLTVLTPVQLRDRLRDSPDVLKDAGAARPERHRSLSATVEWTRGLLERRIACPLHTLGGICRTGRAHGPRAGRREDGLDVLEALAGLVDVALVSRVESGDGRMRFGLPEALRQTGCGERVALSIGVLVAG